MLIPTRHAHTLAVESAQTFRTVRSEVIQLYHPGSIHEVEGVENATCGGTVGLSRLRTPYATISQE